ncbi:hypothetical protein [Mesorhizobium sp. M0203]|uniref:hypothetical protein n=1 Tax=Mesorhizobium sp. M0203 TaxID=2956912 RepID=UPI00333C1A53
MAMVELANTIWADGPTSSPSQPPKSQLRQWGTWLESLANLAFTNGKVFATKAALDADLTPAANTPAIVSGDPTPGNDGLYMKVGATETGSWTQLTDFVPGAQIVRAVDAGAGTPNAIVATTNLALSTSGSQLVRLDVFEPNTGSPVTVAFNGSSALTIKTASGNDVVAAGLTASPVLGVVSGSTFRLLSDQASAAIVAASEAAAIDAEAAAVAAEAARDIAEGFASDIVSQGNVPIYALKATVEGGTIPVGITVIRINDLVTAGDGKGGQFTYSATEPASVHKVQSANGRWFERSLGDAFFQDDDLATPYSFIKRSRKWLTPEDYGASGSLSVVDDDALFRTINNAVRIGGWEHPRPIILDTGPLLVSTSSILGMWDSIPTAVNKGIYGLNISGRGANASRIVMQQDSNVTDKFFYDNQDGAGTGSANNGLLFPVFRDFALARQGAGTAKVHGFRLFPTANGYPSQKWRFFNTKFSTLGEVLRIKGTVNGSENLFVGTHASACDSFIVNENSQALNQTVLGCDFERAKADIFKFTRGSGLTVIGGSYIMDAAATADHYILNAPATSDGITGSFLLQALRTEMRSAFARILNLTGNDNGAEYVLRGSSFRTTTGGARNSFVVDPDAAVNLLVESCELNNLHLLEWLAATASYEFAATRPWSRAVFRQNRGLSRDNVTWGSNAIGWTEISGDQLGAMDFSGGGKGKSSGIQSSAANTDRLKVANGWVRNWPCTGRDASVFGEDDFQVIIPIGSIITAVHMKKIASGATATAYQLEVVDGNGVVLGQSVLAQQKDQHTIDVVDLRRHVTDALGGTIRVRYVAATPGSNVNQTFATTDDFAVEYY